jgi:hypothetical protein
LDEQAIRGESAEDSSPRLDLRLRRILDEGFAAFLLDRIRAFVDLDAERVGVMLSFDPVTVFAEHKLDALGAALRAGPRPEEVLLVLDQLHRIHLDRLASRHLSSRLTVGRQHKAFGRL